MIEILTADGSHTIRTDDFYIEHVYDGRDVLHFNVPRQSGSRSLIQEGITRVYEELYRQTYVVTRVDDGGNYCAYSATLDLTDWARTIYPDAVSGFVVADEAITAALPDDWTLIDDNPHDEQIIMDCQYKTGLEIVLAVEDTFFCAARFDTDAKTITLVYPDENQTTGVRLISSKNLYEQPDFRGSGSGIVTRLYPVGRDGLTIESVNDGVDYIEDHRYTDEVIAAAWVQESYEDASSLLRDAKRYLSTVCQPTREWSLSLADRYMLNKTKYPADQISIHDKIEIYDEALGIVEANVSSYIEYPESPQNNTVTCRTGWASDSSFLERINKMLSDTSYSVTRAGASGNWSWTYNKRATLCRVSYNQQLTLNVKSYSISDTVTLVLPSEIQYAADWDLTSSVWFTPDESSKKITATLDGDSMTVSFSTHYVRTGAVSGTLSLTLVYYNTEGDKEGMYWSGLGWQTDSNTNVFSKTTDTNSYYRVGYTTVGTCYYLYDGHYLVLYGVSGTSYSKAGWTTAAGGISGSVTATVKSWSAIEDAKVYKDSGGKTKYTTLSAGATATCLGVVNEYYLILWASGSAMCCGFTQGGVIED